MPSPSKHEILGYVACPDCGVENKAWVKQSRKGKGKYLYWSCPDCGTDQKRNAKIQSYLWDNTKWVDGTEQQPIKPPNYIEGETAEETEKTAEAVTGEETGKTGKETEKPSKKGLFVIVGGVLLAGLALAGVK